MRSTQGDGESVDKVTRALWHVYKWVTQFGNVIDNKKSVTSGGAMASFGV